MIGVVRRPAILLLLAGSLLIGLAQAALLPPFEGFDEIAHYSYIQQLADTGRWPRYRDPMSAWVEAYVNSAPTVTTLKTAWSYANIPTASDDRIAQWRDLVHAPPPQPRSYQPGAIGNWQAQHPPLYYAVMAPFYLVSKGWSLAAQLLFLRAFSYLIAFGGLCIAALFAWRMRPASLASFMLLGVALWPFFFPMWFPEMARLGNDCLLVPIAACAWALAARLLDGDASASRHALLGAMLGLGLITKATFLPFAAATIGLIACHALWPGGAARRPRLINLALLLAVSAAICGWWYAGAFLDTGSAIGSNDVARMQEGGGLLQGLSRHTTIFMLAKIPWVIGLSFLWNGTWSFITPPLAFILLVAAGAAVLALGYLWHWHTEGMRRADYLPPLTLVVMVAALAYHSLVLISMGNTPAPGWYLHALAPVFAVLVGFGIAGALSSALLRPMLVAALLYSLVFVPLAFAVEAIAFAGCGVPPEGKIYLPLADLTRCAARWSTLGEPLAVLAFPRLALGLFAAGWMCAVAAVVTLLRGGFQASTTSTR